MRLTFLLRQVSSQAALLCLEFWEMKNMEYYDVVEDRRETITKKECQMSMNYLIR